jgi:hypothetical protein
MYISASFIGAVLAFATQVASTGINCQGSSNCGLVSPANLDEIIRKAQNIGDNHIFQNGDEIVQLQFGGWSGGSLKAFAQGTSNGIAGWKVKQLLGFLDAHGCSRCGSVPLNFPNDNDVHSAGMLTVNWVK